MSSTKQLSFYTLVVLCLSISVFRMVNVQDDEISWDVFGYYLSLPATFIYDDPLLDDRTWVEELNQKKQLTGTLYQISSTPDGEPMYFFLLGMALFYLPFFLIAHGIAPILGFAQDGFSMPYQYALVAGAVLYTIIGLIYLRKILRHFFSEGISSVVLVIVVLATNYSHHLTIKNLETVNVLFMLACITIWHTIQWHKKQKLKNLVFVGASVILMAMVKPSEVLIILFPLLWNIHSKESLQAKKALILKHRNQFFIVIGLGILIACPQIAYWLIKTGRPIYDSYKNPGVGLDWWSPHILETLFSFRKGWLIYTPIMIFALLGFRFIYKLNRPIFFGCFGYFIVGFYVISSWSEWWYGAGFSNRPILTLYPVLAIALGYLLLFLKSKSSMLKVGFGIVATLFLLLNQFQWWQFRNYILHPDRTSTAYYWSVFLKTKVPDGAKEFLYVNRDFTGKMDFSDRRRYSSKTLVSRDFENEPVSNNIKINESNKSFQANANEQFLLETKTPFESLTGKDHLWFVVSFDYRSDQIIESNGPMVSFSIQRGHDHYGFYNKSIENEGTNTEWTHYEVEWMTSPIREGTDQIKSFIWNRGGHSFEIDNYTVRYFERDR